MNIVRCMLFSVLVFLSWTAESRRLRPFLLTSTRALYPNTLGATGGATGSYTGGVAGWGTGGATGALTGGTTGGLTGGEASWGTRLTGGLTGGAAPEQDIN